MGNTSFEFKQFTIRQDKRVFKVTTDACILGGYPDIQPPTSICDIGTGTGVLALMMAQKFPEAIIDAIEIDPLSTKQAAGNINSSPWNDRILIFNESIQQFAKKAKSKYDLIICNPPYFEDHLRSGDQKKNLARHNFKLSLSELAETILELLADQGFFYTILPAYSFEKLSSDLQLKGFKLHDKLEIYNTPGKPLSRVIGGFCRMEMLNKDNKLIIYNNEGNYTDGYKKLLKDYYLAF